MALVEGGYDPCECDVDDFIYKYKLKYANTSTIARQKREMWRFHADRQLNIWFDDNVIYHLEFEDRDTIFNALQYMDHKYSDNLEMLGHLAIVLPVTTIRLTILERIKSFLFPVRLKTK